MASRSLGVLTLDIVAKIGGFARGMDQAARITEKRMAEIRKSATRLGKELGIGLAAAATAAGYAISSAIDRADQLYNAAQKIGITTEALSGLEYAAKQADVGLETLQASLAKMVKFQLAAAQGNETAAATFKAFKIDAVDPLTGSVIDSQEQLLAWADVFASLEDGPEKAALAMRLFGKSGQDLIPLLNQGSAGIRDMTEEAERLGLVISNETGANADQFNDQLDRLKSTMTGVATTVAADLLPDLIQLAESFQSTAESANGGAKALDVLRVVFGGLAAAGEQVNIIMSNVGLALGYVGEQAGHTKDLYLSLATYDFKGAAGAFKSMREQYDLLDESRKQLYEPAKGGIIWMDPPPASGTKGAGRNAAADRAAATKLLTSETVKSAGASKAAAEARRAAAEAAREQAERERELREEIEKTVQAQADFTLQLEDLTAHQAGPQAEAQLEYQRALRDIRELAAEGEVGTTDLAKAEALLAQQYAVTTAEIEKRLNPGQQVLEDLQFQIELTEMATQADRDRAIFIRENINATNEQAEAYARMQAQLEESREQISIADNYRSHWEDAFASVLDGSKSVKEAFSDLASSILADIARMLAKRWVEQIFGQYGSSMGGDSGGGIASMLGSLGATSGSAKGNVFQGGIPMKQFALGGVVSQMSAFPMADGRIGTLAEGNRPEAIMPLARDAQGRLGVRGGGGAVINQTINLRGRTDRYTATQFARRTAEEQRMAEMRDR